MFGRWREARESFDRAEAIFRDRCTGVAWELDTVHNLSLWATTHMGDLAALRRRWPVLLQEAQERGDLYAITTLNTFFMTLLRLADDDPEGARRELAAVMGRWSHRGFHVQHGNALRAEVHIDLYRGDGLAAWGRMRQHWAVVPPLSASAGADAPDRAARAPRPFRTGGGPDRPPPRASTPRRRA